VNIYVTLRAIFYLMLKHITDSPDNEWREIRNTVEEALGILEERETNFDSLRKNHARLEGTCTAQGQEINRLNDLVQVAQRECAELRDQLNSRTRGKEVRMHLRITDFGRTNKIPAIKELRSISEMGLADAKHQTEEAYDCDYIEVPIYEGVYRRSKDKLDCWERIPKKKKRA
jgi:hypothetical protein